MISSLPICRPAIRCLTLLLLYLLTTAFGVLPFIAHHCLPSLHPYPDSRVKEIVLDALVHMMYMGPQPTPLLYTMVVCHINKDNVAIPKVHQGAY